MIHELFRLFNWAGSEWVLVILIGLSVVVAAVVFQRWLELSKLDRASGKFWGEEGKDWLSGDASLAWRGRSGELQEKYGSLEAETLGVLDKSGTGDFREAANAYLEHRRIQLEKNVGLIGTIGGNAAFIGLLGTVLGIIRAFHDMSVGGIRAGVESVSGGIAEALVATAIGLLVAIPAVVFFNVMNRKIDNLIRRAETVVSLAVSRSSRKE